MMQEKELLALFQTLNIEELRKTTPALDNFQEFIKIHSQPTPSLVALFYFGKGDFLRLIRSADDYAAFYVWLNGQFDLNPFFDRMFTKSGTLCWFLSGNRLECVLHELANIAWDEEHVLTFFNAMLMHEKAYQAFLSSKDGSLQYFVKLIDSDVAPLLRKIVLTEPESRRIELASTFPYMMYAVQYCPDLEETCFRQLTASETAFFKYVPDYAALINILSAFPTRDSEIVTRVLTLDRERFRDFLAPCARERGLFPLWELKRYCKDEQLKLRFVKRALEESDAWTILGFFRENNSGLEALIDQLYETHHEKTAFLLSDPQRFDVLFENNFHAMKRDFGKYLPKVILQADTYEEARVLTKAIMLEKNHWATRVKLKFFPIPTDLKYNFACFDALHYLFSETRLQSPDGARLAKKILTTPLLSSTFIRNEEEKGYVQRQVLGLIERLSKQLASISFEAETAQAELQRMELMGQFRDYEQTQSALREHELKAQALEAKLEGLNELVLSFQPSTVTPSA